MGAYLESGRLEARGARFVGEVIQLRSLADRYEADIERMMTFEEVLERWNCSGRKGGSPTMAYS